MVPRLLLEKELTARATRPLCPLFLQPRWTGERDAVWRRTSRCVVQDWRLGAVEPLVSHQAGWLTGPFFSTAGVPTRVHYKFSEEDPIHTNQQVGFGGREGLLCRVGCSLEAPCLLLLNKLLTKLPFTAPPRFIATPSSILAVLSPPS